MFTKIPGIGLTVCADFSADIGNKCPMEHQVDTSDFAAFTFGDGTDSVELSFTAESLRAFLELGAEALAEMDGLFATEQAAKAKRWAANPTRGQEAEEATQGDLAAVQQQEAGEVQLVIAGECGA